MKRLIINQMVVVLVVLTSLNLVGCNQKVPQGMRGRVKTVDGWQGKTLPPGHHTCFGRDSMWLVDSTHHAYSEDLKILVGGKVNLTITITIRCSLSKDEEDRLIVFEDVLAKEVEGFDEPVITNKDLYDTFLRLKIESIPREILGSKEDIQTVVANRESIALEVKQRIFEESKSTPLTVSAVEITNYDWPESITTAQEELVQIQLEEEKTAAQVRADLKKAEGQLEVEEANKLVEIKKAEAIAESIDVIRQKLAGAPEYLKWHEIRMLSEAAQGPNNAFIIVPYGQDVKPMVDNAQLKQMLDRVLAIGPTRESNLNN